MQYCDVIALSAAVAAAELVNDVTTSSVMSHQSSSATLAATTAHDDDDHDDDDDYDDNDYVNDVNTTRPHPPLIAQVDTVPPCCLSVCLSVTSKQLAPKRSRYVTINDQYNAVTHVWASRLTHAP